MIRLIFFGLVVVVAFIIWAGKQATGAVSGSEQLKKETFRGQTQKTMRATARGVNWLNEQWEEAKHAASGESDDPPFLALVIAVPDDRDRLEQTKRFFEEYASHLNAMTRVDNSINDGSGYLLARMCIDISRWPATTIRETIKDLTDCVRDLERSGWPAFVVRCVNGQSEVLARNGLV